jgi:beta-phosphoglucomutase family hydrolase
MIKTAIFDMDGVIVDNHIFHLKAWKKFCEVNNIKFSAQEFREKFFGKNNHDILKGLLNRNISYQEVFKLGEAKEAIYREIYQPFIKPVTGLVEFIKILKINGFRLAIATSAHKPNLDFVLNMLRISQYFDVLVDASKVTHSKPSPEIFLKAANLLGVESAACIVFEDSVSGINAAKAAGMLVVALLTTHKREELPNTDFFISDFTDPLLKKFLRLNP